jgi:hypothetical protein
MSRLELSCMSWCWPKSERVKRKLNTERWEYYDEVLSFVKRYRGQCFCKNRVGSILQEERLWISMNSLDYETSKMHGATVDWKLYSSLLLSYFVRFKKTCKARMKEGTWLGVTLRISLMSSIYLPRISSKVGVYLLHTGQMSIWKPIPRPSWYGSFEKDPLQAPQQYQNLMNSKDQGQG